MDMSRCQSLAILLLAHIFALTNTFLISTPTGDCPNPATNCLDETFNKVFDNLGCLGCQTGCKAGYIMTANWKYYTTNKNITEPQWLCIPGTTCPWGHFPDKQGTLDSCPYCGDGCLNCHSFHKCEQCLLGFRLMRSNSTDGTEISHCASTGIACPVAPDHCQHSVYVVAVTGCQGCIICDSGYVSVANQKYRRASSDRTADYVYNGISISGTIELNEPRYTCVQGTTCPSGYHFVHRGELVTCEVSVNDVTVG
ncbi:hypothetical protein Bpfe_000905 [Biomphalaria pfeifferi]|uniref:TNFR-Cys domain-containing protein n=1 Tax=Biomphalaria pfeifferi TaxID=112525 RepID=A0AAD8CCB6_BIOPF|nr:hypothetical protein Bpfe_000905 [Biomphalaria pfeifferi]